MSFNLICVDLESGQQYDRVTQSDMRVPIRLCGEEAEADQEHLEKNGDWEQPGNYQVEHPYPFTDHVVSPLRAKNDSLHLQEPAMTPLPEEVEAGQTRCLQLLYSGIFPRR